MSHELITLRADTPDPSGSVSGLAPMKSAVGELFITKFS